MLGEFPARLGGKQRQLGLALSAQDGELDRDTVYAAGLGQRDRLRLQLLGGEDAAAGLARGIEPDALEVTAELLDRVDRGDSLDLDRHPAVAGVPAPNVDR